MKHMEALLHYLEVCFRRRCSDKMLVQVKLHSSSLPGSTCFPNSLIALYLFYASHHSTANCIKSKQADKGHFKEI